MVLVANTFLSENIGASILLAMSIFTFQNDIKQIAYEDLLCNFRGYILVVYPNRRFCQSFKFPFFLIFMTLISNFVFSIVFLIRNEIVYDVDNQICQLVSHLSFLSIYGLAGVYLIPVSLTGLLYLMLVRYVKQMQTNVVVANVLLRAKNELKMFRRLITLTTVVVVICFPHTMFILLSFFDRAPRYKFRMGYLCLVLSLVCLNIASSYFTDPLRSAIIKIFQQRRQRNTIAAINI